MAGQQILFRSKDGEEFQVDVVEVTTLRKYVRKQVEDDPTMGQKGISINASRDIIEKVLEYCQIHNAQNTNLDQLEVFDQEVVNVEESTLINLFRAARDMKVDDLLNLIMDQVNATNAKIPEINDHIPRE